MHEQIDIVLNYDGWHPTVSAEVIMPSDWNLAIHVDPWTLKDQAPGEPLPASAHWCVSDIITGRLIAIEPRRPRALTTALHKLQQCAEARHLDIPGLLDALRRPFLH